MFPDQVAYIKALRDKKHCRAAAGAGKTFTGSAVLASVCSKMELQYQADTVHRLMFWLTPNREQRDDALPKLRSVVPEPARVAGVGRPRDAGDLADDDAYFDEETERLLTGELASIQRQLDSLETECTAIAQATEPSEEGVALKKQKLETFYRTRCKLLKQKQAMVHDFFSKLQILCMTVDGFLQLVSGHSALSYLLNDSVVQVAVMDEVQQLEACKVAAVACHVQEMLTFLTTRSALISLAARFFEAKMWRRWCRRYKHSTGYVLQASITNP